MSERAPEAAKLDELMMAMDVVDTLRHDRLALERELAQDDRDAALKARLRRLYEGQGLEVTDQILDEGIAALRESRFVYEPPKPSLEVSLAKLWVSRWRWGPWAGGAAVLVILWLGWSIASGTPQDRLAQRISEQAAAAAALAATPDVARSVAGLRDEAMTALGAGETDAAEAAADQLARLRAVLLESFEVRIVSRPGEQTGVERIPDVNSRARNFYIVVEAVDGDGVIDRVIENEETGVRETVRIWAQRVPERTYRVIEADKRDDGIVQNRLLGLKERGSTGIDWMMPVEPAAITEW